METQQAPSEESSTLHLIEALKKARTKEDLTKILAGLSPLEAYQIGAITTAQNLPEALDIAALERGIQQANTLANQFPSIKTLPYFAPSILQAAMIGRAFGLHEARISQPQPFKNPPPPTTKPFHNIKIGVIAAVGVVLATLAIKKPALAPENPLQPNLPATITLPNPPPLPTPPPIPNSQNEIILVGSAPNKSNAAFACNQWTKSLENIGEKTAPNTCINEAISEISLSALIKICKQTPSAARLERVVQTLDQQYTHCKQK